MTQVSISSHAWPLTTPATADQVRCASYPEFVAMINQTNVMPGAFATINAWAVHSRMSARSTVLDVACTTGFASRELARLTGCQALGFDLSPSAVALASFNSDPRLDVDYVCADGMSFDPGRTFSHIAVGAALGFFPDPEAMARRSIGMLEDGGHVLAAPFWCDTGLPDDVAAVRREVFGIHTPMETRARALEMFRGLDVMYAADHSLIPETDDQINHYCRSTIARACDQSGIRDPLVRDAMLDRLRAIKAATNQLRAHQRYTVLVLRYSAATYPNRYVELF